jgi:hypothetical protein
MGKGRELTTYADKSVRVGPWNILFNQLAAILVNAGSVEVNAQLRKRAVLRSIYFRLTT